MEESHFEDTATRILSNVEALTELNCQETMRLDLLAYMTPAKECQQRSIAHHVGHRAGWTQRSLSETKRNEGARTII
jgi:hypothetical protein